MRVRIDEIKNESKSYLTFRIGDEIFATHVAHITHIMEVPKITKVPHSPDYLRGIINLRGSVLPLIDTRVKFGMSPLEITSNTCILVIEFSVSADVFQAGIMVDAVKEVLELESSQIMPPPCSGEIKTADFIYGICSIEDYLLMLLDIDLLISKKEILFMQEKVKKISNKKIKAIEV